GNWLWCATGVALAIIHLAFVPAVTYKIQSIIENNGRGEAVERQRRWSAVHAARRVTVDMGAWLACPVAVTRTVS
ncbi:hypothetical protein BD289DRAFT_369833, partial [Coniella lustricola]